MTVLLASVMMKTVILIVSYVVEVVLRPVVI